jgi:hypothetical protein
MLVLQDTVFHSFPSILRGMSLFCQAHRMLLLLLLLPLSNHEFGFIFVLMPSMSCMVRDLPNMVRRKNLQLFAEHVSRGYPQQSQKR